MAQEMDPRHKETRGVLRAVGPAVLGVGLLLTLIGVGSFFASFGSFEPPRYFWCAFIGLPLVALGGAICRFAFMGAVTRYMAGEVAPVGKDVVNYMVDGTKGSIREAATAVGEGLAATRGEGQATVVRCHKCNEINEASANFCDHCGAALAKSVTCAACGELNDPDARFCDNCGKEIG